MLLPQLRDEKLIYRLVSVMVVEYKPNLSKLRSYKLVTIYWHPHATVFYYL